MLSEKGYELFKIRINFSEMFQEWNSNLVRYCNVFFRRNRRYLTIRKSNEGTQENGGNIWNNKHIYDLMCDHVPNDGIFWVLALGS